MKTFCTVHVIALNKDKQFLVLQRANHRSSPGKWNCITGYVEERESAEDTAVRELKEETNLEGKLVNTAEPYWKDSGDTRWIVTPSLIEITNVDNLVIDVNESQDHKWIDFNDEIVKNSDALSTTLKQLGLL